MILLWYWKFCNFPTLFISNRTLFYMRLTRKPSAMCDIPDTYRSVCRSVVWWSWWCWAMINVLYWLETVETSPSLPGSSLLCVVWTLWTGPSVHHLTRSHRREAANEKQVNQFYQTFYLSHILFLFAPVWALNAATLATDAHMALGAQPSQVLAALLSTDIHKSICPFLLLNF